MASKIKVDTLETANGSGTIALSNQLSGMTTASLPTLTSAEMPTGSVLQVVHAIYATAVGSSSSTYADTGLTASITPTSTSSKVLVTIHQNGVDKRTNNTYVAIKLLRGSSVISTLSLVAAATGTTTLNSVGAVSTEILDSPSSTSSVTYKTQFASAANSATAYVQMDNVTSTITLTEIQG